MICISVVTWNRQPVLQRVLDGILTTTIKDDVRIVVTNNGSTDGTREFLEAYEAEGKLKAWHLNENMGTASGRNAHWGECIGHDSVRMDDKVLPLADGWLTSLKRISDENHAIVATPYDPTVMGLYNIAPPVPYLHWTVDMGQGGPLIFIPAQVTEDVGAIDELCPEIRYGWDDCLQIERARLLGWHFGFSLRTPVEFLARADPNRRNAAMDYHGLYLERLRQYREAERDVFIPIESTIGYCKGKEARACS